MPWLVRYILLRWGTLNLSVPPSIWAFPLYPQAILSDKYRRFDRILQAIARMAFGYLASSCTTRELSETTDAQGFSSTEGGDSTCIKQRDGLIGTEFGTAPATKPPTGWRWAVWLQQEILRQKLCGKGLSLEGIMSIPLGREIWWIFMSFFLRMSCFSKISQAGTGRLRSQLRWHDNVATRRSACKGLMSNTFRKFCGAFANFISIHAIRF